MRNAEGDRNNYNQAVWERIVDMRVVSKKLQNSGFKFHHEISTNGVAVSLLYSKIKLPLEHKQHIPPATLPGFKVGLDPGKRNIFVTTDKDGRTIKYSAAQRNFESRLQRYRSILSSEKKSNNVEQHEDKLSKHCSRTNDRIKYLEYLACKAEVDEISTFKSDGEVGSFGCIIIEEVAKQKWLTKWQKPTEKTVQSITGIGQQRARWAAVIRHLSSA